MLVGGFGYDMLFALARMLFGCFDCIVCCFVVLFVAFCIVCGCLLLIVCVNSVVVIYLCCVMIILNLGSFCCCVVRLWVVCGFGVLLSGFVWLW